MKQRQHANATTTPEMRAFIRESDLPTAVLARLLKISESTVRKWRQRENTADAPHKPKTLQTTLSPAQEYVVIELRKRLLLSLDELLAVCQEFINPEVSRAGLQRCLKRHGLSRLADVRNGIDEGEAEHLEHLYVPIEERVSATTLSAEVSTKNISKVLGDADVVNVEVSHLPDFAGEPGQRRLLIANDPESRWVYVDIYDGDEKDAASRYMTHVLTKSPFHIRRILAGNYNDFLSRFRLLDEAE
jgi:transposase-like protein